MHIRVFLLELVPDFLFGKVLLNEEHSVESSLFFVQGVLSRLRILIVRESDVAIVAQIVTSVTLDFKAEDAFALRNVFFE